MPDKLFPAPLTVDGIYDELQKSFGDRFRNHRYPRDGDFIKAAQVAVNLWNSLMTTDASPIAYRTIVTAEELLHHCKRALDEAYSLLHGLQTESEGCGHCGAVRDANHAQAQVARSLRKEVDAHQKAVQWILHNPTQFFWMDRSKYAVNRFLAVFNEPLIDEDPFHCGADLPGQNTSISAPGEAP